METLKLQHYPSVSKLKQIPFPVNPRLALENALSAIFPTEIEETKLSVTKRRLGETSKQLTDEQIECMVRDFQYLIDSWLDEFEKDVFEGKTLIELVGEKEYANNK